MSDKMRWRYGDTNPVVAAVEPEAVIEIGDLLYLDDECAKPAALLDPLGMTSALQAIFARAFLGVALERSRAGDIEPIRVATTGVFEYDCPSDMFGLGQLVGVDREDTLSGPLCNQRVCRIAPAVYYAIGRVAKAIGRVAKRAPTPVTSVLVAIQSTVMTGGVYGRA